jgi:hypothetical protein
MAATVGSDGAIRRPVTFIEIGAGPGAACA